MSRNSKHDVYRNAIALCHEYPESRGVVTKKEFDTYDRVLVRIRDPLKGLLFEHLIRDHGFLLAAQTRRYDDGTVVLFA